MIQTLVPIRLDLLPLEERQEILSDLFRPDAPPERYVPRFSHGPFCECMDCWGPTIAEYEGTTACALCEQPGDFSCFSLSAPWDRQRPQRHVHICPECVRMENLGESIGTKFSTCGVR